jgi:hypothetical protein
MAEQVFRAGPFKGFSVQDEFAQAAMRESPVMTALGNIPWPSGLAPTPTAFGSYAPGETISGAAQFKADVLVVLYTDVETEAFLDVFTGNPDWSPARRDTWNPYAHNFSALQDGIEHIDGDYALEHNFFGYLSAVTVGGLNVAIYKTELHPKANGPALTFVAVIQQLVSELAPSLVLTTGTAGGTGSVLNCGDVVVASDARFFVTTKYPAYPQIDALSKSKKAISNTVAVNAKSLAFANANLTKLTLPALAQCYAKFANRQGFDFLRKNTAAPTIYTTDVNPVPGPEPMAIVSADFLSVDDPTDAEGLQALGVVNDNDDAYAAFAVSLQGDASPEWLSVRNVSDPQVAAPPPGTPPSKIRSELSKLGGAVYGVYQYVTTLNSAFACWAIVAGKASTFA